MNLLQKAIKDVVNAVGSSKTAWENGDRISKFRFNPEDGYARTDDM